MMPLSEFNFDFKVSIKFLVAVQKCKPGRQQGQLKLIVSSLKLKRLKDLIDLIDLILNEFIVHFIGAETPSKKRQNILYAVN